MKIERRDFEDFSPRFAVKLPAFLNPLIFNKLEIVLIFGKIVKIFHNFYTPCYPPDFCIKSVVSVFSYTPVGAEVRKCWLLFLFSLKKT